MIQTEEQLICSEILKKNTKEVHAEAEVSLMPTLKGVKSVADYIKLLQLFYGFFAPLEKEIYKYINADNLPDLKERRASVHLKNDLKNSDADELFPVCDFLPYINNTLQALGALYVVEGSSLGGLVIAKMLKENAALHIAENQLSFFNGYGKGTMQMWNTFKLSLNETATTKEQIRIVTTAAIETFEKFKTWIEKQ